MSDEEVIRRRLLIDGDGTGDDRRLNNLIKGIIKWSNATGLSAGENELMYDRLLQQVAQCEYSARRSRVLRGSSRKQLRHYDKMQRQIDARIGDVVASIHCTKAQLEEAKVTKGNRLQYGLLAMNIRKEPARADTLRQLAAISSELEQLEAESRAIDLAIDKRRRDCHVLFASANEIRELYEQEDAAEEDALAAGSALDDIANSPNPELICE